MVLLVIWDYLISWVLFYVGFSILGLLLFNKLLKNKIDHSTNELIVNTFNISGVLFSLFITFVVVTVWSHWEELNTNIIKEANSLSNLYSETHHMPDSNKLEMRRAIRNYTELIINEEWPAMASDLESQKTLDGFMQLRKSIHHLYNANDETKFFYSRVFPIYLELSDIRRNRLHQNFNYLPNMVWYILFTGSLLTIFISFFYRSHKFRVQFIMNFLLAIMFSMGMFLCYDFNHPFRGQSRISSQVFQVLLDNQFVISDSEIKK